MLFYLFGQIMSISRRGVWIVRRDGMCYNIFRREKGMTAFFVPFFSVLILDQLTKALLWGREGVLIPGVMNIANVKNTGSAMGALSFMPSWLHFALAFFALAAIVTYACFRRPSRTISAFLGCIAGGAAGNLADRILRGYVADLFETVFIRFYVFNLADAAIVIGCIACAAAVLFGKDGEGKGKTGNDGSRGDASGQPGDE